MTAEEQQEQADLVSDLLAPIPRTAIVPGRRARDVRGAERSDCDRRRGLPEVRPPAHRGQLRDARAGAAAQLGGDLRGALDRERGV